MDLTDKELKNLWAKRKTITLKGKKYRIGLMSYGDYFIEPITWKGGEQDRFSKYTKWFKKKIETDKRGLKQVIYSL